MTPIVLFEQNKTGEPQEQIEALQANIELLTATINELVTKETLGQQGHGNL
jgi:prefoldin subunit 5